MGFLAALGATALSGLLYGLSFPPHGWRPLAWVALVPFLLALRFVGPRAAAGLGFLWAIFACAIVADAVPEAVEVYYLQPKWVSWPFGVGVWAFTGSLYYMVFAPVYRALSRRYSAALPLLAAAAWVAMELARARLLTFGALFLGNPWALAGYSQASWTPLVQIVSVTGIYGVSFVLVAVNAALAELLLAWRRGGARAWRTAGLGFASAAVALGFVLGFGVAALGAAQRTPPAASVPVAVVQGNIDLGARWQAEFYGRNLDTYMRLTIQAFDASAGSDLGRPELVVWPEGALTFFLEDEPAFQAAVTRLLRATGLELVVGGPSVVPETTPPVYYNSIYSLDENGALQGRYDKEHLVPFSEYFPLQRLDFVRRRFDRVRVFAHGTRTGPLPTRAGPAGVLICNEAMLPEVAAERVRAGADWLVNPSNDSWWASNPKWAEMMFEMVALRAVEQRRYLVRASTAGPSAIVDPWGRVEARSERARQAVILGRIVPRSQPSLYARVGDLFAFAATAATAAALLVRRPRAVPPAGAPRRGRRVRAGKAASKQRFHPEPETS